MKPSLLCVLFIISINFSHAQNTDLPAPTANLQFLPLGSYIIAMGNSHQNTGAIFGFNAIVSGLTFNWTSGSPVLTSVISTNNILVGMQVQSGEGSIPSTATVIAVTSTTVTLSAPVTGSSTNRVVNFGFYDYVFNFRAYGLIVNLLNNNIKLKWSIKAGKVKDDIDITVNANRILPTLGTAAVMNFKAGPFVIFASDTAGVGALVNTFNNGIANANEKVKIYKTNTTTIADIRYNLTGFIPKGAVLTDGGNQAIHMNYYSVCRVPAGNYFTLAGSLLTTRCYTFASEPHNSQTGAAVNEAISNIKTFVQFGGNFLAQCAAVLTYENNTLGRFQTTTGITGINSGVGTAISYPNPDLAYTQYEGSFNISKGGSVRNWRVNASGQNNYHPHARGLVDPTIIGASVSKHFNGSGGLVYYLGNHRFDDELADNTAINGLRMFMNAFLTPTIINNTCNPGDPIYALPVKLISFFGNINKSNKVSLQWKTSANELADIFEVQRKINGTDFITIASVFGTQKAGEEEYSFNETINDSEKYYYRLKIINKGQIFDYSKILFFQNETAIGSKPLALFNNPVYDKVSFSFSSSASRILNVKIYDMTGRMLLKQNLRCNEGNNILNLPVPLFMKKGLYILIVSDNIKNYVVKFEKQ